MASRVVVAFSGGLDSTTLLYHLRDQGHPLRALSFDYGQRHQAREASSAQLLAAIVGVPHETADLRGLATLFGRNSLTDHALPVPDGEYSPETMAATVVPNRNMILLSVAIARAIALEFDAVAFGAHAGEYTPYADCQPPFAEAMNLAAQRCHSTPVGVLAPFVGWSKADIVRRGAEIGVPFGLTWSCYKGLEHHCGECGTCVDRRRAFADAGLSDPTQYARS